LMGTGRADLKTFPLLVVHGWVGARGDLSSRGAPEVHSTFDTSIVRDDAGDLADP